MSDRDEITQLLQRWTANDPRATSDLFERIYDDLRAIAGRRLAAEKPGVTLQPTVLVNELFLKLVDQRNLEWQNRAQFFGVAARILRRILVDHARARDAQKRGGEVARVSLDELTDVPLGERPAELIALDACLTELELRAPDKARLVELRFFAGLSLEETAEALGISRATAVRQWRLTKGLLLRLLQKFDAQKI
jgi:RNA polymerase sigma factor (TIGR02999 family)